MRSDRDETGEGRVAASIGGTMLLAASFYMLAAGPGLASDGIIEISQTCATAGGCTPGDLPGFPVTVPAPGASSYRLTSDLLVPDTSTTAILVAAPDVSIDLNGFEIARAGCVDTATPCTTAGVGAGVATTSSTVRGVSVRNGSVTGLGGWGISLGEEATVRDVRVRWNGAGGIRVFGGGLVEGCLAHENGSTGIFASIDSTVRANVANDNASHGLLASSRSSVRENVAHDNGGIGIIAGTASTVIDNASGGNVGRGLNVSSGATVSGNASSFNSDVGLGVGEEAAVHDNVLFSNSSTQMSLGSGTGYSGNVVTTGLGLSTVSGGVDAFSNLCDGALGCP